MQDALVAREAHMAAVGRRLSVQAVARRGRLEERRRGGILHAVLVAVDRDAVDVRHLVDHLRRRGDEMVPVHEGNAVVGHVRHDGEDVDLAALGQRGLFDDADLAGAVEPRGGQPLVGHEMRGAAAGHRELMECGVSLSDVVAGTIALERGPEVHDLDGVVVVMHHPDVRTHPARSLDDRVLERDRDRRHVVGIKVNDVDLWE